MNILDSVISYVSPAAALKRTTARAKAVVLADSIRKYEAAAKGRRTDGWNSAGSSSNTEIRTALTILRDRSRDMVRNNPYAKRAMQVIGTNTVGTGIRPTASAGKQAAKKIKEAWKYWAESTKCDHSGTFDFYGLQSLVMKSVAESGECLVIKRRSADQTVPLELQVVEADLIDHNHDGETRSDGSYTIQGIEFNESGKRVGYWLYNRHPGESGGFIGSKLVPASDVLHIYRVERPGQVRGVPFGTSGLLRLKDFDDFEDAQLMRQKIAACFSIFVTDPQGDSTAGTDAQLEALSKVEPGTIEYLKPGKEVTFASPPPAEGYSEYSTTILHAIAMAYGVTYESLTGDLSNVNFSSARMGWLEFHRLVNEYQSYMLIPRLCRPVWAWFMEALKISINTLDASITAEWTTPRREMINPVEEIKAMSEAVRSGFMTWSEAIRQSGYDPEVVVAELKSDFDIFDANGFMLACDARYDANRAKDKPAAQFKKEGKKEPAKPA